MKKIIKIGIFAMLFLFSIQQTTFCGLFGGKGGSGIGKIIKILDAMKKTQFGMSETEAKIYLQEIEEVKNTAKMLENDARMLKGLDQSIKQGDIDAILNMINKVEYAKDATIDELRRKQAILDNISKFFSLKQNEFKKEGPRTQKEIKEVEDRIEKMRDDVKKTAAKINQKSQEGYSLKKEDLTKLKEKVQVINNADGEVAVLQAIGALAGQTNEILIDIKELIKDQNNLLANLQQSDATEKDAKDQAKKEEEEENDKNSKEWEKQVEDEMSQKVTIKFGI